MIFCVEDDSAIRELMTYTLQASGFETKGFVDGDKLWDALATEIPQLIMLDIMLPGEDGIEILKKLRSNTITANIPVVMATAKGTEYDTILGLDMGADDYLAKPFGMMEMVSRVKAVLRRSQQSEKAVSSQTNGKYVEYPEATPSKEGYTFKGWDFDIENTAITGDVAVNAVFEKVGGEKGGCMSNVFATGSIFCVVFAIAGVVMILRKRREI